jgi:geranylgeranylglycerol-phosphate geranylgeranyltransferase
MALTRRLRGFLELTRPGNVVAAGVLTFTGAYVAGWAMAGNAVAVGAAVLATTFATGAGNAINDYFDREIDRVNDPDRPIPRGAVSPRGALAFSAALFLGAIVCAVLLPLAAIAIAVFNLLLLIAYTKLFKGVPGLGNVVVGFLTGSTFLFGGAAVGSPFGAAVLFVLAAIATLTREIVKDVEDLAGDREQGLTTLPIAIGADAALRIGLVAMVVAVLASVVPYLQGTFDVAYLAIVVPADLVMLYGTKKAFTDPSTAQKRIKAGMLLAVVAFIVGRAVA